MRGECVDGEAVHTLLTFFSQVAVMSNEVRHLSLACVPVKKRYNFIIFHHLSIIYYL